MAAEGIGPRLELGREAVGLEGEGRHLLAGGGEQIAQRLAGVRGGPLGAVERAEADVEARLALEEAKRRRALLDEAVDEVQCC